MLAVRESATNDVECPGLGEDHFEPGQASAADWRIADQVKQYQNALTDVVEQASRAVVDYAAGVEQPVLAMEDLGAIRERFDYDAFMNRCLHSWAFVRLQSRIEDKAHEAGIPVVFVPPAYTSQVCHACRNVDTRPERATFRCPND